MDIICTRKVLVQMLLWWALMMRMDWDGVDAQQQCNVPVVDALFIIDSTPSVTPLDHQKIKNFVKEFVKRMSIGLQGSRVGVLQFTPMARPEFYPNIYLQQQRVQAAINLIQYVPCENIVECYGATNENASVSYVSELGLSSAVGNRPSIPDVIIIITTGVYRPHNLPPRVPYPAAVSQRHIFTVQVGRGGSVTDYTVPSSTTVTRLGAGDYSLLGQLEEPLCQAIVRATTGRVDGFVGFIGTGNGGSLGGSGNGNGGSGGGGSGGSNSGSGAEVSAAGIGGNVNGTVCVSSLIVILLVLLIFFLIFAYIIWRLQKKNKELEAKVHDMGRWGNHSDRLMTAKQIQATEGPGSAFGGKLRKRSGKNSRSVGTQSPGGSDVDQEDILITSIGHDDRDLLIMNGTTTGTQKDQQQIVLHHHDGGVHGGHGSNYDNQAGRKNFEEQPEEGRIHVEGTSHKPTITDQNHHDNRGFSSDDGHHLVDHGPSSTTAAVNNQNVHQQQQGSRNVVDEDKTMYQKFKESYDREEADLNRGHPLKSAGIQYDADVDGEGPPRETPSANENGQQSGGAGTGGSQTNGNGEGTRSTGSAGSKASSTKTSGDQTDGSGGDGGSDKPATGGGGTTEAEKDAEGPPPNDPEQKKQVNNRLFSRVGQSSTPGGHDIVTFAKTASALIDEDFVVEVDVHDDGGGGGGSVAGGRWSRRTTTRARTHTPFPPPDAAYTPSTPTAAMMPMRDSSSSAMDESIEGSVVLHFPMDDQHHADVDWIGDSPPEKPTQMAASTLPTTVEGQSQTTPPARPQTKISMQTSPVPFPDSQTTPRPTTPPSPIETVHQQTSPVKDLLPFVEHKGTSPEVGWNDRANKNISPMSLAMIGGGEVVKTPVDLENRGTSPQVGWNDRANKNMSAMSAEAEVSIPRENKMTSPNVGWNDGVNKSLSAMSEYTTAKEHRSTSPAVGWNDMANKGMSPISGLLETAAKATSPQVGWNDLTDKNMSPISSFYNQGVDFGTSPILDMKYGVSREVSPITAIIYGGESKAVSPISILNKFPSPEPGVNRQTSPMFDPVAMMNTKTSPIPELADPAVDTTNQSTSPIYIIHPRNQAVSPISDLLDRYEPPEVSNRGTSPVVEIEMEDRRRRLASAKRVYDEMNRAAKLGHDNDVRRMLDRQKMEEAERNRRRQKYEAEQAARFKPNSSDQPRHESPIRRKGQNVGFGREDDEPRLGESAMSPIHLSSKINKLPKPESDPIDPFKSQQKDSNYRVISRATGKAPLAKTHSLQEDFSMKPTKPAGARRGSGLSSVDYVPSRHMVNFQPPTKHPQEGGLVAAHGDSISQVYNDNQTFAMDNVSRIDRRDPLGFAAAATNPEEEEALKRQFDYDAIHFNDGTNTPAFYKDLEKENQRHNPYSASHVPINHPGGHLSPCDVVFLVDNSGSIGNFNFTRVKDFLIKTSDDLHIAPGKSRMGVILFNMEPRVYLGLEKYFSNPTVRRALERIPYSGGGTMLGKAISYTVSFLNNQSKRFRKKNPNAPNRLQILTIISDGFTEDNVEPSAALLHENSKAKIATVGVRGENMDKLETLTRDPDAVFKLDQEAGFSNWMFKQQYLWEEQNEAGQRASTAALARISPQQQDNQSMTSRV